MSVSQCHQISQGCDMSQCHLISQGCHMSVVLVSSYRSVLFSCVFAGIVHVFVTTYKCVFLNEILHTVVQLFLTKINSLHICPLSSSS